MEFADAYEALLSRWPGPVEARDVPTPFGPTRVNIAGDEDKPALVLLPGGGATSTVWFAVAGELASGHRVYAVDLMGDAGHSVNDGTPLRTRADLLAWLDAVTDHCGLAAADLCGHSYGGWLALTYALHAPQRIRKLALLDPTGCFAGISLPYLWHAAPLVARPSGRRMARLLHWETRGAPLDPGWLAVVTTGADRPRRRLVVGPRPNPTDLNRLSTPTLVMLAERSRVHDIDVVAARARELLPHGTVIRLRDVSHHSLPTEHAAATGAALHGHFS